MAIQLVTVTVIGYVLESNIYVTLCMSLLCMTGCLFRWQSMEECQSNSVFTNRYFCESNPIQHSILLQMYKISWRMRLGGPTAHWHNQRIYRCSQAQLLYNVCGRCKTNQVTDNCHLLPTYGYNVIKCKRRESMDAAGVQWQLLKEA